MPSAQIGRSRRVRVWTSGGAARQVSSLPASPPLFLLALGQKAHEKPISGVFNRRHERFESQSPCRAEQPRVEINGDPRRT